MIRFSIYLMQCARASFIVSLVPLQVVFACSGVLFVTARGEHAIHAPAADERGVNAGFCHDHDKVFLRCSID